MRLASGRSIEATANHRFRTLGGWVSLDELAVGSRVAVPRRIDQPDVVTPMDADETRPARPPSRRWLRPSAPADPLHERRHGEPRRRRGGRPTSIWHHATTRSVSRTGGTRTYRPPISSRMVDAIRSRPGGTNSGSTTAEAGRSSCPTASSRCPSNRSSLFLRHLWATDGSLSLSRSIAASGSSPAPCGCTTRRRVDVLSKVSGNSSCA